MRFAAKDSLGGRQISCPKAFTLLELLAVLVVLSILVALLFPSFSAIRAQAQTAESLATMRQVHFGLVGYMQDHRMAFPYMAQPTQPNEPLNINSVAVPAGGFYFRYQTWYWTSLVLPYISGRPVLSDEAVFIDHSARFGLPAGSERVVACRYFMTHTVFAVPEFWHDDSQPTDNSLLRGTRFTQMKNPARKGILIDAFSQTFAGGGKLTDVLVGMGDGSVSKREWHSGAESVSRPAYYVFDEWPIMTTRDGLAGIDY